jgi:hypothetical protein
MKSRNVGLIVTVIIMVVALVIAAYGGAHKEDRFARTADTSITALTLDRSPSAYVGKRVDLQCTVSHIVSREDFIAHCGDAPVGIDVSYDTGNLSVGQNVRVLGIVQRPFQSEVIPGGGKALTVSVKALYLE